MEQNKLCCHKEHLKGQFGLFEGGLNEVLLLVSKQCPAVDGVSIKSYFRHLKKVHLGHYI